MNTTDLVGKRFGRLVIKEQFIDTKHRNQSVCLCDCGKEKVILTGNIKRGLTTSCGCFHSERISEISTKHGLTGTRIYHIYTNMVSRCHRIAESTNAYPRYRGRGIKVCDEWLADIKNFYSWAMVSGYEESLTIDRIDNDGDYEPSNCHWIPIGEQSKNTSMNHPITFDGETMIMSDWARKAGLKVSTLHARLKFGWDTNEALTIPILNKSQSAHGRQSAIY